SGAGGPGLGPRALERARSRPARQGAHSRRTVMRAECRREGLLSVCQLASAAVPSRDVKPILKNLKAVASDGRCTLMATDMEVGIRLDVRGLTIQEPGEAILPAAQLIAILREARDEQLSIEADPSACLVRGA